MASLTKHRVTIDRAQDALESRILHFELAVLDGDEEEIERMRGEVKVTLNALIQAVDALRNEYLVPDAQEPLAEQLT